MYVYITIYTEEGLYELYENDPCGPQFESQDIFSHLSKK